LPLPVAQRGHFKLQTFVGSMVKMEGLPHIIFFLNTTERKKEREFKIKFFARLNVNDFIRLEKINSSIWNISLPLFKMGKYPLHMALATNSKLKINR
jgi:hypothetical protein